MARVLVIHHDSGPRKFLEARAGFHNEAKGAAGFSKAVKALVKFKPDVILVGIDARPNEAMDLIRHCRRTGIQAPIVVVGPAKAGTHKQHLLKLGAVDFVEYPMEQTELDRAITQAMDAERETAGKLPPLSPEEVGVNSTDLQNKLNRHMVCFAGKGQVYIQSLILGNGKTSPPRIALKCPLRQQYHYPTDVYYEYIRDVCCADPSVCPAYQDFQAKRRA